MATLNRYRIRALGSITPVRIVSGSRAAAESGYAGSLPTIHIEKYWEPPP